MYELKTKPNNNSVEDFLNTISSEKKKIDAFKILEIMKEVSSEQPIMWGDSIIGFGSYKFKYKTGHSGEFFTVGFSPRVQKFSIYLSLGCMKSYDHILKQLGKYKMSVSCLYINKLDDVNINILKKLIKFSIQETKNKSSK